MPLRNPLSRRLAPLLIVAGLGLAGCGGGTSPSAAEDSPEQADLLEVGEMYRIYIDDNKRPPRAVKDVLKYAPAFNFGSMALQEKRVVVLWGADLQAESTEVLAYEAKAPESGGAVLLRDGLTVKAMTPAEFQAAAKSPGKLEDPGRSKAAKNARAG
ncbi:hypothetical protein [Paludisphaera mucosa]|uniref:Uncharacterized protein n=1 Tax=Paludisphaera mucosa TaxID=3030827 RepID=A0ABT6FJ06_9BACT|nr:hypothetical protein [Paludisphaera mucosa]MDG3007519.1 hypothetical protein [Paludisphaera mucosa]